MLVKLIKNNNFKLSKMHTNFNSPSILLKVHVNNSLVVSKFTLQDNS